MLKTRHAAIAMLLAVLASGSPLPAQTRPAAEPRVELDRWYSMLIEGQPSGHAHTVVVHDKGQVITTQTMKIAIKRGAITLAVGEESTSVETEGGSPVEFSHTTRFGQTATTETVKFTGDAIELTREQAGKATTTTRPLPKEPWLTERQAAEFVQAQSANGDKEIKYKTLSPANDWKLDEVTVVPGGKQNIEVMGRVVPAVLWKERMASLASVEMSNWVDEKGDILKTVIQIPPGLKMVMVAADKELALAEVSPPELLISTMVKAEGAIAEPRKLRTAVFELKIAAAKEGGKEAATVDLPRGGYQRVVWGDEQTARVVVDMDEAVAPGADLPTDDHRRATPMLDCDDAKIKGLLAEALKSLAKDAGDAEKAHAIRAFVFRFIEKKDLSVGLATASEVARTAQGDCTEHAVLAAALLRAAGIPSRTVAGLLYMNEFMGQKNVFGYHMWAQAWIAPGKDAKGGAGGAGGGRWVDYDGVLKDGDFDATHIALAYSAMTGTVPNDLVRLGTLFGRLSIRIVEPASK